VHQHRQHLGAEPVAATVHARAHRAFDHRVDDLEVGRVERQAQVHRAARGRDVRAKALVILDVTGRQILGRGVIELGEQVLGHLAQGVDEHVEAAAVGHADHDLLHAFFTGALDDLVHRGNEALAALEREALLADILGVQVALEALGRGQAVENMLFLLGAENRLAAHALKLLLPPALLLQVGRVHVLDTQGAAVGLAQCIVQLAQRHLVLAEEGVADVEDGLLVRAVEAVVGRVELGDVRTLGALEGIEVGVALADVAVGGDQLLHRGALAAQFGIDAGDDGLRHATLGTLGEGFDDRHVRHVARVAAVGSRDVLQRVEIVAPVVRHAGRVGQVVFIHLFHVRRVAAEEIRVAAVGGVDVVRLAHGFADLRFPRGNISW